MKPANIKLFSTDLEGTLLGRPESTWRFTEAWDSIDPVRKPLLVYNTGRTVAETRALVVARGLPEPDHIIGSIGTELYAARYDIETEFCARFNGGWSLEAVNEIVGATPGVRRQPSEFPQPFKSSWIWVRAAAEERSELDWRLRRAGIRAHLDYSCRYFLDVVPASAGKGGSLAWLCKHLCVRLGHVLVAGDTASDKSMFLLPGVRGIVVGNALPELLAAVMRRPIYVARSGLADGVLEGLQHFGLTQ